MGVGWGTFILCFVGAILIGLSLANSQNDLAGFIYFGCAAIFAVVVMLLAFLPKAPVGSVPDSVTVFDLTYYPRIAFILLIMLGSLGGLLGIFVYYVLAPVYAINPDS
ncbi:hypothetical protein BCR33DRAFT_712860 [Rhizoclosmatium globosum]|uniref:Uncharacterized protein n=1 Tax=Rhizoclosmatium globosum TaxID=329046 RepID=A0A1Y2CX27_9FUNG|nr:hypothetical protein BCR33DRAFT_712860 [Rhizoclosmatium globosum]|eukprot:ORY50895.1 hypothetical protein BCR33DRAFT_712860 [Rhizoclosmatium globosum]